MSAASPRAREPSEFCLCRAVSCPGERTPPLDSGPSASPVRTPVRIPVAVIERYPEGWHTEQQRIRDAANAKRSEAAKDRPRNDNGTLATSAATSCGATGSDKRSKTNEAKAAASKTNRGSVEHMNKLHTKRPEPREQGSVGAAVSILLGARRAWHTRLVAEKALGCLSLGEKSLLLLCAFEERNDAERVLQLSALCGVRAPVAQFSLAKLMYPALFNAGAFSENRPKGRRAVIDAEVRRADQLLGGWLRMGSAAFLLACALNPPTSGEIQNPAGWQDVD